MFAHPIHLKAIRVKFVYQGHWVMFKVTRAKNYRKSLCKTSIGKNCVAVKHRAVKYACSMEFSDMADRLA